MNQSEKRLFLIQSLLNERPSCQKQIIPADSERQKILLRGLVRMAIQNFSKNPVISTVSGLVG